jgi:hypothetical protein
MARLTEFHRQQLVMRFVCFILLCFWNFNKRPNPISRLVLSLFLLLPPVFSRLDVFSWLFLRLDAKPNLSRSKCFPLIRLDLVLHIVPRIRYLGFTLKGGRVP